MAFQSFFTSMETTFSNFLDSVVDKKNEWNTKEDLLVLFKQVSGEKITSKQVSSVQNNVQHSSKQSTDKCTFIITRGEKMGEKCNSRVKTGTEYCIKHYKPSKDDDKTVTKDEPLHVTEQVHETKTLSLELKFKKEDDIPKKMPVFSTIGTHKVVKNTKVVVNDLHEIIGYLNKTDLVYGSNKELDSVSKEFNLLINKSSWATEHIDE